MASILAKTHETVTQLTSKFLTRLLKAQLKLVELNYKAISDHTVVHLVYTTTSTLGTGLTDTPPITQEAAAIQETRPSDMSFWQSVALRILFGLAHIAILAMIRQYRKRTKAKVNHGTAKEMDPSSPSNNEQLLDAESTPHTQLAGTSSGWESCRPSVTASILFSLAGMLISDWKAERVFSFSVLFIRVTGISAGVITAELIFRLVKDKRAVLLAIVRAKAAMIAGTRAGIAKARAEWTESDTSESAALHHDVVNKEEGLRGEENAMPHADTISADHANEKQLEKSDDASTSGHAAGMLPDAADTSSEDDGFERVEYKGPDL